MRRAVRAACLAAALAPGVASAGPRPWLGPALALDPAFAAGAAGVDWFVTDAAAAGICAAATLPGAGDQTATERGYAFFSAVARLRAPAGPVAVELLGGGGLARIRFGSPGAHTELAPDLVLGAALGIPVGHHLELAVELAAHVTLGATTAARNPAHTSELLVVALRWAR
jgi:hypothetical protein